MSGRLTAPAETMLALGLARGRETWTRTSGGADPSQVFAIGSVTKTFVAAATLRLRDRGLLNLDAPLAEHLPEWARGAAANGATVRHALSHRSGIPEHVDRAFVGQLTGDPSRSWTPREVLALVRRPSSPAPAPYGYSNSNYLLLGLVVEQVAGLPLGEVLEREFIGPLNLEGISFPTDDGHSRPSRAVSSAAGAAGGIVATADALARWGRLLYGGHVLTDASLAEMVDVRDGGYGLGAMRLRIGRRVGIGHVGEIVGFSSLLAAFPDEDLALAVLADAEGVDVLAIAEAALERDEIAEFRSATDFATLRRP